MEHRHYLRVLALLEAIEFAEQAVYTRLDQKRVLPPPRT